MKRKRITVCADPYMSLKEWKDSVEGWIRKYGEDATMEADAGPYNVELKIEAPTDGKKKT